MSHEGIQCDKVSRAADATSMRLAFIAMEGRVRQVTEHFVIQDGECQQKKVVVSLHQTQNKAVSHKAIESRNQVAFTMQR